VTGVYYERHARRYFEDTVDVDLGPLYGRFLANVPPGGALLDAGCGSGRDVRRFRAVGYRVEAFDASAAMAALASEYLGLPAAVRRFQEVDWQGRFDGVWACASLLHVLPAELPDVLRRLINPLRENRRWMRCAYPPYAESLPGLVV